MENNIKLKVLDSIGKIYETSKECKLEGSFFTKMDTELSFLSEYFQTTKSQSFFVALVFALNYKGDTVDLNDLIEYFDCNPMKILEYSEDFTYLYASGIFSKQKSKHRVKVAGANDQFVINEKISVAILQNRPMPEIQEETITDVFELLEKLYNIGKQRDEDDICSYELFEQSRKLLAANLHFPLIKKIDFLQMPIEDAYIYLYLVWKVTSGSESTDLGRVLEGVYDSATLKIKKMQKLLSGENELIQNNLIEIVEARFFNDTHIKLTDYSQTLLKECGINLQTYKSKKDNIVSPAKIPYRELIFGESEMKQLFLFKNDLHMSEEGYLIMGKRFAEKSIQLINKQKKK